MNEVRRASDTHEGDGARVKRLMPIPGFMNFDPFVLFDNFELAPGTGFPPHPHRGFEAITYLFTGEIEHRDNLGNVSRVGPGGAQRFTAGHGIVHSEMPSVEEPTRGIQLWINLPARLKASAPAYQEAGAETMVEEAVAGGVRRVIVGEGGPVALMTPVRYVHYRFTADGEVDEPLPAGWRAIVYVLDGEMRVNGEHLATADAYFAEDVEGLALQAQAGTECMFVAGLPHGEPIRQRGPFVD